MQVYDVPTFLFDKSVRESRLAGSVTHDDAGGYDSRAQVLIKLPSGNLGVGNHQVLIAISAHCYFGDNFFT